MNKKQKLFLEGLGRKIPKLIESVAQGNNSAEYLIGHRQCGNRLVRLKLVAVLVKSAEPPLKNHGSTYKESSDLYDEK